MFNKFKHALICLLFAGSAQASPLTYLFYVSGDNDYRGPTTDSKGKVKIVDKAELFFKTIRAQAAADTNNRYAIYYDKKGGTFPFGSHRTYFEYFVAGKRVHGEQKLRQIDSTSPQTFLQFAQGISTHLSPSVGSKPGQTIFYYYGEHVPETQGWRYDSSSKGSTSYDVDQFSIALGEFQKSVPIDLLVLQSCLNNSVRTVRTLHEKAGVRQAVIPSKPVNRSFPSLDVWAQDHASIDALVQKWLAGIKDDSEKFPFLHYRDLDSLSVHLKRLESEWGAAQAAVEGLSSSLRTKLKLYQTADSAISSGKFEDFLAPVWSLPLSNELFIGLPDAISHIATDQQIEFWENTFKAYPELAHLLISI